MDINKDSIRIAVVDDDPLILSVFSSLMKQADYYADFFPSSAPALRAIEAHPGRYDLLVVDIQVPDGDGVTFAKKVRALFPEVPIMFMTGGAPEEKQREARALGRTAFLNKPFPLLDKLGETIQKFVSGK